jgi:dihydroflavonol-4-reductase
MSSKAMLSRRTSCWPKFAYLPMDNADLILVTGATGFVGASVARVLLDEGYRTRILRRHSSRLDLLEEASDSVEHAIGDVLDYESVREAMDGVTYVFHVAANVGRLAGRRDTDLLERVNVSGTANVVNAALEFGVRRLVHTSSMAAFGRVPRPVELIDESTEWVDSPANSEYACSKRDAELEVLRAVAEGLDAVIVNPALVFGIGRAGENTRQVVDRVRRRRFPAVPTGGTCVVDVLDVAAGHLGAMRAGTTGERYFLGSENLTWKEIVGTLARAFGVPEPSRRLHPRLAMAVGAASELLRIIPGVNPLLTRESVRQTSRFYRYDNTRARTELNCHFRPFRETAERIAEALVNDRPADP